MYSIEEKAVQLIRSGLDASAAAIVLNVEEEEIRSACVAAEAEIRHQQIDARDARIVTALLSGAGRSQVAERFNASMEMVIRCWRAYRLYPEYLKYREYGGRREDAPAYFKTGEAILNLLERYYQSGRTPYDLGEPKKPAPVKKTASRKKNK